MWHTTKWAALTLASTVAWSWGAVPARFELEGQAQSTQSPRAESADLEAMFHGTVEEIDEDVVEIEITEALEPGELVAAGVPRPRLAPNSSAGERAQRHPPRDSRSR